MQGYKAFTKQVGIGEELFIKHHCTQELLAHESWLSSWLLMEHIFSSSCPHAELAHLADASLYIGISLLHRVSIVQPTDLCHGVDGLHESAQCSLSEARPCKASAADMLLYLARAMQQLCSSATLLHKHKGK